MRIAIEIDPEVEDLLPQAMRQSRRSFEIAFNQAIRRGLAGMVIPSDEPPFVVKAKDMGLRPGIDPMNLQQFADEMEVDAYLEVTRLLEARRANSSPS